MKTWQIFRTAVNRKNKKFRSVLQPMTVLEQMTVASCKYNYINKYIFPLTVQCYRFRDLQSAKEILAKRYFIFRLSDTASFCMFTPLSIHFWNVTYFNPTFIIANIWKCDRLNIFRYIVHLHENKVCSFFFQCNLSLLT